MRKVSFIVSGSGVINAAFGGRSYTVPPDHMNYREIKKAIVDDDGDKLDKLVNVSKAIETFSANQVVVRDGVVYFNNEPLHNTLTDRILGLIRDGFPFEPMALFLGNLMNNPSYHSVQETYTFLEHHGLPITEDGCFLAYKRVRNNYMDYHTGTVRNMVGDVVSVPRNTVDDNWRVECSSGFHVGSIEYVRNFYGGEGHVMIVKVNPADVVSVPATECTKMRVCKYVVMGEYDRNLIDPMPDRLHTAEGVPCAVDDSDDNSWDCDDQ